MRDEQKKFLALYSYYLTVRTLRYFNYNNGFYIYLFLHVFTPEPVNVLGNVTKSYENPDILTKKNKKKVNNAF